MNGETGSVKFTCEQIAAEISRFDGIDELNRYRRALVHLGMLGVDANGIGFGNVSVRDGASSEFYITGSATGALAELSPADCAKVVAYDFAKNWLRYKGTTVASSESLTHAAVYEWDSTAGAVIHCHDMQLWSALLNQVARTPEEIEYGTPAMAYSVRRLFELTDVRTKKIFVMAGHEGGIVTFGENLEQAFGILQMKTRN